MSRCNFNEAWLGTVLRKPHYSQHVIENKANICKRDGEDIAKSAFKELWNDGTLMAGCSDSEGFNTPNGASYTLTLRRDK